MVSDAKLIWLDVTSILHWNRPVTGVLRVEMECARHFLLSNFGEIRFCQYNQLKREYVRVSAEELSSCLQRLDASQSPDVHIKVRAFFLKHLKTFGKSLPHRCRSQLIRLKRLVGSIHRPLYEGIRKMMPLGLNRPGLFKRGDVYISLGCDWADKDMGVLLQLKKEHCLNVVLCCHDIIPVIRPDLTLAKITKNFEPYLQKMIKVADHVLCVSECTRKDLLEYIGTNNLQMPELSLIRHGATITVQHASAGVDCIIEEPYILCVSTFEPRKNHSILYGSYLNILSMRGEGIPVLLLVGMAGWGVEDLLRTIGGDERVRNYIRVLHDVSDSSLDKLYANALFTVYPSHYEGWGLPVAESLAHGKFCLASSAASIPEVGGGLVEYVDPTDEMGWAERILYYIDNQDALRIKENRIRCEYNSLSWGQTSRSVFEVADGMIRVPDKCEGI